MTVDLEKTPEKRYVRTIVECLREGDRFWWTDMDTFTKEPLVVRTIVATVRRDTNVILNIRINDAHVCAPHYPVVLLYKKETARTEPRP